MSSEEETRSEEFWTKEIILLLITTRLKYENQFKTGKRKISVLWNSIVNEIKNISSDFNFNKEVCKVKFTNLLTTYKRIKKRNSLSGRSASAWPYFELFDEVYAASHFVSPPRENIGASLEVPSSPEVEDGEPATKRHKKDEILEFLKSEAINEENRHQQSMEIERERLKILKSLRELFHRDEDDV